MIIRIGRLLARAILGPGGPGGTADAYLLEDGSSGILLEDGSSYLLME